MWFLLTLSTLSNYCGLFYSLFWIKLKQSVGVKGLNNFVSFVRWIKYSIWTKKIYKTKYCHILSIELYCWISKMFFSLEEMVKWLGMTSFELWMHLVSVTVFSVLSILKFESVLYATWWAVFRPLFVCDALCAYFCIIVFIRTYKERGDLRAGIMRLFPSLLYVTLLFVFKVLFCQKLSKAKNISHSEVMAPLFILLQIILVRACHVH